MAGINGRGRHRAKSNMRKKIFHNMGLKLGSLVLAFILWLLVIQIGDPMETNTFRNIQVNMTNTELLDQQNKVYEVLDNTDRINVQVRAPRSVFEHLRASDIVAEADMSKLTEINTIVISCSVMNVDVDTVKANPDVLRLNVENRRSKQVNVRYNIIGDVAEGYMVSSAHPEVNRFEVTGPESAVAQISYACLDVDVSDASSDVSVSVETVLYDSEGKELDLPSVTKTANYVRMDVEILATKEVPVNVNVSGMPAEGYLATGVVESSVSTVMIAGRSYYLNNISSISIPEEDLDITGATDTVTQVINIKKYLPDNIILADSGFDGNVNVTIYVEPKVERNLEIPISAITPVNVPAGFLVQLSEVEETYQLRVSGLEKIITALQVGDIRGTVDLAAWMAEENLKKLPVGVHMVPVTFSLPEGVTIELPMTIPVTITELEDE